MAALMQLTWLLTMAAIASGCATLGVPAPQDEAKAVDTPSGYSAGMFTPPTRDPHQRSAQARDLWQRLRQGFEIKDVQHSSVERELARWMSWPATINEASVRAGPFFYHVVEETERRSLPAEFALVPFVETGFHLTARSHRNAVGLWQIMPATGQRFGLGRNWWYDGRQDFLASTNAALEYLSYLYQRFDGDPLLALAAYNAGEGRIDAARTQNRNKGRGQDFWSLSLPSETRSYVPRVLALAQIIDQPERYGVQLAPIANRPVLVSVETGGQIELAVAAELAELDADQLRMLNPGYLRWATAPEGPHLLIVPELSAQALQAGLEALPTSSRVRWDSHRVARGDTLWDLSRHYGVSTAVLRQTNGLRGDRIRVGQTLLVPRGPGEAVGTDKSKQIYVVRRGDSLWSIARRFGVSHRQIATWNGLRVNATIRPGKRLLIWA